MMKLKIKKIYFDLIREGVKTIEYRDAHITFVCEETGEELYKGIKTVFLCKRETVPRKYREILEDQKILAMVIK